MSLKNSCISAWETLPVTISNGASLSSALDLGGLRLFAVCMPDTWTSAKLTFQMSCDGGTTWLNVLEQDGTEIAVTPSVSTCHILTPADFASLQYLRLRSGTASSAVVQGADRTIQLILRPI